MEDYQSFLDELVELKHSDADDESRYSRLSAIFGRFLDSATYDVNLTLVGRYAKADYLLKEHKASGSLCRLVHDARVRLRDVPANASFLVTDIDAVARFIALVGGGEAPAELLQWHTTPERAVKKMDSDCVRVAVESFDNDYLYVRAVDLEGYESMKVAYRQPGTNYPYDRSYLADCIEPGDQLNLISPAIDPADGCVIADLIIYNPDYLVNISQIAGCFETYTTDSIVSLLKKVMPAPNTEAINLGNFASQLLDETVHSQTPEILYPDSVRTFFTNNAINLATCELSNGFHDEARSQRANIRKALCADLVDGLSGFDAHAVMLEPSFFCERLGLQGRMDLLSLDFTLLIEQKAGKGRWPYDFAAAPLYQEPHYVQLLLYMAVIRYSFPDKYKSLRAMLLYSKYYRPLVSPGYSPRLVFEALKIRNQIVADEIYCTRHGFENLFNLNADNLNTKGASTLWTRYTLPALRDLLNPLHLLTPVEAAYYKRMTRFVAKEHMLSKVGSPGNPSSGLAAVWQTDLAEKLERGRIYPGLTMISPAFDSDDAVQNIVMSQGNDYHGIMTDFRPGDIVVLYAYEPGTEPDVRRDIVFRCSIDKITDDTVELQLRCPQSSIAPFAIRRDCLWAIEHDFMEASYSSLYRGLHAFLMADGDRLQLLMFMRPPKVSRDRRLIGDYGDFNDLALRVKQADELFMIIGPPGTGKTSFGLMTTLLEELHDPSASVLLMAYTNRAVDEICSKLVENSIDFIRLGSELSCGEEYRDNLLDKRAAKCNNIAELRRMISSQRVYVGTIASVGARLNIFKLKNFSLAIIDEASQILEPQLAGILAYNDDKGHPAIKKIVMIGDRKQLPAVVQQPPSESAVHEPELNAISLYDCRNSLFERLLSAYSKNSEVTYMLTRQGRMHHDIADFPNRAFYDGRLQDARPYQQTAPLVPVDTGDALSLMMSSSRIAFVDVCAEADTTDKSNPTEADLIARMIDRLQLLYPGRPLAEVVGVIVPYRNQISVIRGALADLGLDSAAEIAIDTVERFQGSQKPVIIYGFTVSKAYQLNFLTDNIYMDGDKEIDRKLNVAMTRAQEHLFMVGNATLLADVSVFAKLLDYVKEKDKFYDAAAFAGCTSPLSR